MAERVKRYKGIDYGQRPASYWDDQDVLAALLRNVKGGERREMIRCYWEQGRLDELGEALLKDSLSEDEREEWGQIHPLFMGGEYLPDYKFGEVEIARIELDSTLRDVVSIRARKAGRRIRYRIVDEYGTGFRQGRQTSLRPLSLGEFVAFLEGSRHPDAQAALCLAYNEVNAESCARKWLRHFTRVSSVFYPGLGQHYENVFSEWVAAEKPAPAELDEEETARADGGECEAGM